MKLFGVIVFVKKEYFYAATSILLWSTVATTTKLLLGTLNSFQVLWVSSFFAAVFMLLLNLFTGKLRLFRQYTAKDVLIMALIGLPGTFFYYVFYYAGTSVMPASQAFIVNYMWPIMSVLFACIILKEKMTVQKGVAIAISFVGVMIVTGADALQLNMKTLIGAGACLSGAVCYGVFTALNQKFHYAKQVSVMINYMSTFLLTTIINAVSGNLFVPGAMQSLGFVWNGAFTMALACMTWMLALESGKTAKISNFAYITPFLSLVWTALVLKEQITWNAAVGLCVIVVGIFVQFIKGKRV